MNHNTHSTQFFAIQRYRRKMSWLLFGLFVWVVGVHLGALLIISTIVSWGLTQEVGLSWWFGYLVCLLIYFVFAAFLQSHRLKNGGQTLARQLGAIRLFLDKTGQDDGVVFAESYIKAGKLSDFPSSYGRFYEFAEQMSLASGVPCPKLYVLPNESGINGFVAGFDDHDMVMVLTQGAVERLNNEALYALIGHEFGHILHGDARLNLRLYVMMAGLSLFYECADWLEELLLGKFHANYHSSLQVDTGYAKMGQMLNRSGNVRQFNTLQAWSDYQSNQASIAQMPLNARTGMNVLLLPVMGLLVLMRIFGVFGMESLNWLKSKFNHQRELLADATSMQLTRSFGMVALLKIIQKHDTTLYSTKVSAMDYFFFANPNQDRAIFSSHPDTYERLEILQSHAYDTLGLAIVADLDLSLLKETHDHIARHAPVVALKDEVAVATFQAEYHSVPFEQFADTVVDGRLVVDDKWRDWDSVALSDTASDGLMQEKLAKKSLIYPYLQYQLTKQPPINERCDELADIRLNDLEWGLAKYLRQPLGLLALLEMTMLCRFEVLDGEQAFDFFDIFIKLPCELPHLDKRAVSDKLLPHHLNADSLTIMSRQARLLDVAMVVKILKMLPVQLANNSLQFKAEVANTANATLTRYAMGIGVVFGDGADCHRMTRAWLLDGLWQGAVLTGFAKAIESVVVMGDGFLGAITQSGLWQVLEQLDGVAMGDDDSTIAKKAMIIILMAVMLLHQASIKQNEQNNPSLNADELATFGRWCRLVGVGLDNVSPQFIQKMATMTAQFGVMAWAGVFWALGNYGTKSDIQTLHTAFLYDNQVSQKEQGILAILDTFLG